MINHLALVLMIALLALTPHGASANELPNLMCTINNSFVFSYDTKEPKKAEKNTIYRINDKKLYINDQEKKEYLYDKVEKEADFGRYTSAYKTIIFSADFSTANVVHVSSSDTQISEWKCHQATD